MPHPKLRDAEMRVRRVLEGKSTDHTADLAEALNQIIRVLDDLLKEDK
jgi:hypothetical protein